MKQLIIVFACLVLSVAAFSHGGKKHKKDSTKAPMDSTMKMGEQEHIQGDTVHHHDEGMTLDESKVTADLDDFPTLHPLIVHFAIVLILVAAGIQLLNLYFMKKKFHGSLRPYCWPGCWPPGLQEEISTHIPMASANTPSWY